MNSTGHRSTAGFTLIELLSAVAILIMLIALLFAVFNQVSRAWILSEGRTETFQNSRIAIEMISRELESAMVSTNRVTGRSVRFVAIQGTTDSDISGYGGTALSKALNTSAQTASNDQVFFVAPAPEVSASIQSELHEFGYFVMFATGDTASMKGQRYYLLRMDNDAASSGFDIFTNPMNWYKTPASATSFGNTAKPPLLDNVLRFKLDYEALDSSNPTQGTKKQENWTGVDQLPRAVHITLSVLDRRVAERLAALRPTGLTLAEQASIPHEIDNIPASATSEALKNLMREGLRTFHRSVYLRNAP